MYWYKVYPLAFHLLHKDEQRAYIDAFQVFLNALPGPISVIVRKKETAIELEDKVIETTVFNYFVGSRHRLDRLLDKVGLRYQHLLMRPPRLADGCVQKGKVLKCHDHYVGVISLIGLPPKLRDGWLYDIVYPTVDEVFLKIGPVSFPRAISIVRKHRALLRALMSSYEIEGKVPREDVATRLEVIEELEKELHKREVNLFTIRLGLAVKSESSRGALSEIKEVAKLMEAYGFQVLLAPYSMVLSIYELQEPNPIFTDTLTLSTFFPFISATLMEVEGVFLGRSRLDNSPVFLDIWSHKSYNMTVLGMMGTGKSALAKKIVYEYYRKLLVRPGSLAVFIIDRTGEYVPVLKAIGAQVIQVKRDVGLGFDPFRLLPPEHASSFIASQLNLGPKHIAELHKLAAKFKSLPKVYQNSSRDLKQYLSGLIEGPLGWIYRGESLRLEDRVGVVLRDLGSPEAEGVVGAMFLLAFIQKVKDMPLDVRKILVIDEYMQVLEAFKTYDVVSWLLMFFKNTRKWFTSVIYIAHDPREVADTRYGRIIASQLSPIKVLFQHDVDAAESARQLFNLSDTEVDLIINADVGDALLISEGVRLPVHIELSSHELQLFETRPWVIK